MKQILSLGSVLLLLTFFNQINAQVALGTFNIRAGAQLNAVATFYDYTVVNGNTTITSEEDTSGVAAIKYPIGVDVGLLKFLSVGLYVRPGTWADANDVDDDVRVTEKSISELAFSLKLYAVNKPNFNLYLATDFGVSRFERAREASAGVFLVRDYQSWSGSVVNVNIGLNAYFGGKFGMYFQTGYLGHNFNLDEYTLNGNNLIGDGWSANLLAKGASLELGFCYKLGEK